MRARRGAAMVLAAAVGCAPSLAKLERGHHYREAICGAEEGAFTEAEVAAMLRRGLDPAIHATVVSHAALAAAVGDPLAELQGHALVRVVYSTNAIPNVYFRTSVSLRGAGGRTGALVELATIAARLHESVPGSTTVAPNQTMQAIGTIGAVILTVASLGLFSGLLRGGGGGGSQTVAPSPEAIRRAAPRASAVLDAVGHLQTGCDSDDRRGCSVLLLVDQATVAGESALALDLWTHGCGYVLRDRLEISLPPGADLEGRLAALFGGRMRRVAELPTRAP